MLGFRSKIKSICSHKQVSRCYLHLTSKSLAGENESKETSTSVDVHLHKLERPVRKEPKLKPNEKSSFRKSGAGSLIPETLESMEKDLEFQKVQRELRMFGQAALTKEEKIRRQRALDTLNIPSFNEFWKSRAENVPVLDHQPTEILQLNIGLYCNQACSHCHVESSPRRKEMMDRDTAKKCLELIEMSDSVHTVDITGGAPELCDQFRYLVQGSYKLNKQIIDRCNLTALKEPGQETTARFLADHGVQVIASLPCYSAKNVNLQRGKGVFQKSVQALFDLNDLGYGKPGSGLELHLVYNPLGAFLPPNQSELEAKYREELWNELGIEFNRLFVMTNMPIKRFADFLYRRGELKSYMELLVRNFNPTTLDNLMCRTLLSVRYDGKVFDCDFNQQLNIPMRNPSGDFLSIFDLESLDSLTGTSVSTDNHCFGCTAGHGSS